MGEAERAYLRWITGYNLGPPHEVIIGVIVAGHLAVDERRMNGTFMLGSNALRYQGRTPNCRGFARWPCLDRFLAPMKLPFRPELF